MYVNGSFCTSIYVILVVYIHFLQLTMFRVHFNSTLSSLPNKHTHILQMFQNAARYQNPFHRT